MKIDDPRVAENLAEMSRILARIDNGELIEGFFRGILTPAETADIAARWALVKALDKRIPQREIAQDLGLSLCKITRGSRELKKADSALRRILRDASSAGNDDV